MNALGVFFDIIHQRHYQRASRSLGAAAAGVKQYLLVLAAQDKHPVGVLVDDSLQQAIPVTEMVLQGIAILLACRHSDLIQGHRIDTALCIKLLRRTYKALPGLG